MNIPSAVTVRILVTRSCIVNTFNYATASAFNLAPRSLPALNQSSPTSSGVNRKC